MRRQLKPQLLEFFPAGLGCAKKYIGYAKKYIARAKKYITGAKK